MTNTRLTTFYDRFVHQKADISSVAPHDIADLIRENVTAFAPQGLY